MTTFRKYSIETLVKKVGGSFALTALIQKRLKELKSKNVKSSNLLELVCEEILSDKLTLIPEKPAERSELENVQEMLKSPRPKEKNF